MFFNRVILGAPRFENYWNKQNCSILGYFSNIFPKIILIAYIKLLAQSHWSLNSTNIRTTIKFLASYRIYYCVIPLNYIKKRGNHLNASVVQIKDFFCKSKEKYEAYHKHQSKLFSYLIIVGYEAIKPKRFDEYATALIIQRSRETLKSK